jgi:HEAT repeat protein
MRSKGLFPRLTLIACLAFATAVSTGCDDPEDPKTWVGKLNADNKRPGAMRKLREMFQSRLSMAHDNINDPNVKQFLDATVPAVNEAFVAHPEEVSTRKEAIEILAASHDARAIPALLNALEFHAGNSDSERIALRAAQALREMHPENNPQVVQKLLACLDRASTNSGSAPAIRESVIYALAAIHDRAAVQRLIDFLKLPIDRQEIRTARASADALGLLGDPQAADALIYGLYLNIRNGNARANAFNNCARALVRLGPDASVPKLIDTVNGQNPEVAQLLTSYANVPGMPPVPPGMQQSTAIDVLRNFADARSIDPLLALLRNRETNANVRGAAAESLGYAGLALPREDPRRAQVFDAIADVFNEGTAGGEGDMSPAVAPALVILGDPRAPQVILRRLRARELQAADTALYRLGLLMPLASATRHGDFADFDRIATTTQNQLEQLKRENPDAESEINPVLAQLATIRQVATVARDCNDGDIACYQQKLGDAEKAVVRKAAYMIAWTGGENPEARAALLARANSPDILVRRSINTALDSLSPHGCAECVTRLEAVIASEEGQESKSVMHLEAQMLIARLRNRH